MGINDITIVLAANRISALTTTFLRKRLVFSDKAINWKLRLTYTKFYTTLKDSE